MILQTAFITLDEALKVTNRRVNALENVVKPKLENTISYIKGRTHGPGCSLIVSPDLVFQGVQCADCNAMCTYACFYILPC